ncbi:hypothetical protein GQ43DRAFT_2977 [Delitschia confertaspora ATCC 74209]|uniref:Uncharacterized protein n=1 Tax=Delitschia confertaspora ATCC 74209 TaxID=1513339 RepID=A0A9P4K0W2_9PLEO|nr:hypothetical protein GQ43DRAFT_2977 [Delitschia confertaspora ATCC 74209]
MKLEVLFDMGTPNFVPVLGDCTGRLYWEIFRWKLLRAVKQLLPLIVEETSTYLVQFVHSIHRLAPLCGSWLGRPNPFGQRIGLCRHPWIATLELCTLSTSYLVIAYPMLHQSLCVSLLDVANGFLGACWGLRRTQSGGICFGIGLERWGAAIVPHSCATR